MKNTKKIDRQKEIEKIAFDKWQAAGSPCGDGTQFWLEAEREWEARPTEPLQKSLKQVLLERLYPIIFATSPSRECGN